jgi:uncharacterized membrane protein (DUF373 family)
MDIIRYLVQEYLEYIDQQMVFILLLALMQRWSFSIWCRMPMSLQLTNLKDIYLCFFFFYALTEVVRYLVQGTPGLYR